MYALMQSWKAMVRARNASLTEWWEKLIAANPFLKELLALLYAEQYLDGVYHVEPKVSYFVFECKFLYCLVGNVLVETLVFKIGPSKYELKINFHSKRQFFLIYHWDKDFRGNLEGLKVPFAYF